MSRISSLNELLSLSKPLSAVVSELSAFEWDAEHRLVEVIPQHIVGALEQFLAGSLSAADIEAWANAIECREDLEYSPDSSVGSAIHELANPVLTKPLTRQSARAWVAELSSVAT